MTTTLRALSSLVAISLLGSVASAQPEEGRLGSGSGGIIPVLEGRDGSAGRAGRAPRRVPTDRPPRLVNDRAATLAAFVEQERREGSTGAHMSFLDRGLKSSPLAAEVGRIPERLAATPAIADKGKAFTSFPDRGEQPGGGDGSLRFLHPAIRNASVVVGSPRALGFSARWYGRASRSNDQHWSATKILQALHVVSAVRGANPDLSAADAVLVDATKPDTHGTPLSTLVREIVSYEAGAWRSNSAAGTLGRLFTRADRERWNVAQTGHEHVFRGNYGAKPLTARPELLVGLRPALTSPEAEGMPGPNLLSSYDLTRLVAMAAWHPHLSSEQRIEHADWRGLSMVLEAMGHDSARYADAALDRLGVRDRLSDVVIATKLGHGIRSRTGLAETVYSGVVQFVDNGWQPARWRSVCFTLRGEHRSGVQLDAIMAGEMTELLRRVLDEELDRS
jgi:hypothetical protein